MDNPLLGYRVIGSTKGGRTRSLIDGELEKLLEACNGCLNKVNEPLRWRYYAPLAIYLAVETGMRLQEIFNLEWGDIDTERRRIIIQKSKTDHLTEDEGRTIVLPIRSEWRLRTAKALAIENGHSEPTDKVFPLTKNGKEPQEAFERVWKGIIRRSGIVEDYLKQYPKATRKHARLHFHDLRRTANTNFYRAGLDEIQREIMLGHSSPNAKSSNRRYINPDIVLPPIQEILDKYFLGDSKLEDLEKGVLSVEGILETKAFIERLVEERKTREGLNVEKTSEEGSKQL